MGLLEGLRKWLMDEFKVLCLGPRENWMALEGLVGLMGKLQGFGWVWM